MRGAAPVAGLALLLRQAGAQTSGPAVWLESPGGCGSLPRYPSRHAADATPHARFAVDRCATDGGNKGSYDEHWDIEPARCKALCAARSREAASPTAYVSHVCARGARVRRRAERDARESVVREPLLVVEFFGGSSRARERESERERGGSLSRRSHAVATARRRASAYRVEVALARRHRRCGAWRVHAR